MFKKISRVSFFSVALSFALTGYAGAAEKTPGTTVKIAVAGPMSGANAAFGEQLWRGAQQAAEDINKAGGINGKKIQLVKGDDACEPKQAVAVANRLVDQDKVAAVVGHFCSESTIPASEVYDEADILMMTPASTNPTVTERNMPTIFRMCGRDDQQGAVAADFMMKTLKAKAVAIVHDKTTYGRGLADAMKNTLNKNNVKEVIYEGITRGEKDFNALVTKFKSQKIDVVYFGGVHAEAGLLLNQMRNQGIKAKFISGDGIVSNDFVTSAGGKPIVEGVYVTFGPDPRKLPNSKAVVDTFKKGGYDPEGYTLYSYSVVQSIAEAVKGTNSVSGKKLAEYLRTKGASTVMGKKDWDKKGDLRTSDYVMYQWNKNGEYNQL